MDDRRFDDLARLLAAPRSRRAFVRIAAGGAAAGLLARLPAARPAAAARRCQSAADCPPPADPCRVATCAANRCGTGAAATGTPCDDGNACTRADTCRNGACVGGTPVVCTAPDQCHLAGACDPATGQCANPNAPDGTRCDDGNACTTGETCQGGVCGGGAPVVCAASDRCHVAGTCDPATGACSNPDAEDGTGCNDGNRCTTGDTCRQGVCTGGAALACDSNSPCIVDSCDPATGCVQTLKTEGAPCADGDRCDGDEVCDGRGVCAAGTPVTCAAPADARCQEAGVCDPVTGACTYANRPDGTACALADQCYRSASCQQGVCTGYDPVVCAALDRCHVAGACDAATGACSNPNATDGTPCDDGNVYACTTGDTCQDGVCVAGAPVVCDGGQVCLEGLGGCVPVGTQCTRHEDCVPWQCCHPNWCVPFGQALPCDGAVCTSNCDPFSMDCGQGFCGCQDGWCVVLGPD